MLYLNLVLTVVEATSAPFNFNKCCIWIGVNYEIRMGEDYLTLTSVVFEYIQKPNGINGKKNLTLTSVVFELYHSKVTVTSFFTI